MMKFYADLFALTEDSISAKSIRRLRWLTIGSLPLLPMVAFWVVHGLPRGYGAVAFMIAFVLVLILTGTVLLARIVNRVWAPDKYLDEWEKDLKRKSMTMAFMVVIYVCIGIGIAWELFYDHVAPHVTGGPKALPALSLMLILGAGFYTQIFTQLSLIEPMDDDELDEPQYVVTSSRSILGIITLTIVVFMSGGYILGFYSGDRDHKAAEEVCGDVDINTHKRVNKVIEVTCEGSETVIRLDPKTLKPILP